MKKSMQVPVQPFNIKVSFSPHLGAKGTVLIRCFDDNATTLGEVLIPRTGWPMVRGQIDDYIAEWERREEEGTISLPSALS